MASSGNGQILLVSGSTRSRSTCTALLRTVERYAGGAPRVVLFTDLVNLPHFDPDHDTEATLPQPVADLRAAIESSSAVLFCTPEYASALPGSFKNLLDWTVGGGEMYGKPTAWINASAVGAADAHDSLAKVLARLAAQVVDEACQRIPVTRSMVDADGLIADATTRERVLDVVNILRTFSLQRNGAE